MVGFKTLTIDGETKLITEWARHADVPARVIRERLKLGWSGKRLLDHPRTQERYGALTIDGETKSAVEWARQAGIPASVIRDRRYLGWTGRSLLSPVDRGERHGDSKAPEWRAYYGMIARCYKPSLKEYARYGGRGVKVCDRWRFGEDGKTGYACFLEDMGRRPADKSSIDRINTNGDYTPRNCRWADAKQQALNRRSSVMIEHNGKKQCIAHWAREIGISVPRLHWRLKNGWSVEDALTAARKWDRVKK